MMTPNMQGVIMAIGKSSSTYEKNGPEAAFFKVHTACPLPFLIPYSLHLKPAYLFLCICFMVFSCVLSYSTMTAFFHYSDFNSAEYLTNHIGLFSMKIIWIKICCTGDQL